MDTAARARELALLGVEVRATQSGSTGNGGGGQTAHEPAGSSKGGQFTSSPHGGSGLGTMPTPTHSSSGGAKKTAPAASVPAPPGAKGPTRTLKQGQSGEDVRYLQYAMNLLGFKVAQDGVFGADTATYVKQMQDRLGLPADGHVNASMLRRMQDAVRLSPCVGGQRDLAFEAQWEARDAEDVDDELDEDTEALIEALGEFIGADERSFTEALHPRNPKGSAGGGRFRSIVDRVVDALSEWKKGNGPDDPLKDFNREQLMKAAKAHGHTFRRGASIEEIKAQILDDVRNGTKAEKAAAPHLPGAPADHRRFTIQLGGKVDPAAVREVEVENKIRAAYERLRPNYRNGHANHWLGLADLREATPDVSREELDAALVRMGRGGSPATRDHGFHLIPIANSKALTPRDRAAEVSIGGEGQHAISFEDASPLPLPKPSGTATDVGIFGNPTTGKLSLYRESDTGKRTGRAIKSFADMAGLESWARDNGHTELADYAKAEQVRTGGAAKAAKAVPADAVRELNDRTIAQFERHVSGVEEHAKKAEGLGFHPGGDKAPLVAHIDRQRADFLAEQSDFTPEQRQRAKELLARHDAAFERVKAVPTIYEKLSGDKQAKLDAFRQATPNAYASFRKQVSHGPSLAVMQAMEDNGWVLTDRPGPGMYSFESPGGERGVTLSMPAREGQNPRFTPRSGRGESYKAVGEYVRGAESNVAKAAEKPSDPLAGLEGLTPVQKRAALRKRGLSKAEIDALAPLESKKAVTAAPAKSAPPADSPHVASLKSRLAAIETEAKPIRDEVLKRRQSTKVYDYNSNIEFHRSRERLKALGEEGSRVARELLDNLAQRDGEPWGGDPATDAARWEPVRPSGSFVDRGTLSEATRKQLRDAYVVNDQKTLEHNASLRSGNPTPAAKAWAAKASRLVNSSELTHDTKLARGAALPPEAVIQLRPGAVIHDRGIVSAAETGGTFKEAEIYMRDRLENNPGTIPTMFEIRAPKGTAAADVGYGEVVLDRDQRFRIVSSRVGDDGVAHVVMELIPK